MIIPLLFILSLICFSKKEKKVLLPSILSALALLVFHCLFLIEHGLGEISYFISDEQVYLNLEGANKLNEDAVQDRYLWFLITGFISHFDITGGLFSKLISLPLIPVIIYLIYRISGDDRALLVFAFLPYFLFIMQTALRDSLIITITLYFIYLINKPLKNSIIYLLLLLILVFLLRPFYLALLLVSVVLSFYVVNSAGKSIQIKLKEGLIYLLFGLIISLVVYLVFQDKFDQYIRTLTYYYEFGITLDEEKTSVKPSFSIQYIIYAVVRFVFTPLPYSLFERIMSGGVTQFGYVDDFIRMINQVSVVLMISYIIVNFRMIPSYFRVLYKDVVQLSFLIFVTLNTFVYSLYYAGGGHSRLKIILFLGLLIFSLGVSQIKCQKKF